MKKKDEIVSKCIKCGNLAPIDEERSNEQWKVYKIKCTCGGDTRMMLESMDIKDYLNQINKK